MSCIRGRDNKGTELAMVRLFRAHGVTGWRRQQPVFGRPDFVFHKQRLAVFVDGCFWHSCPIHGNLPASNRVFWKHKLDANRKRDRLVNRTLKARGWQVLRIWEHELKRCNEPRLLRRILRVLCPNSSGIATGSKHR